MLFLKTDSSSLPIQAAESIDSMQNHVAQIPLEDDAKNPNAAEFTVAQNSNKPIVQHSDSVVQKLTEQTVIQYSDSAIHNPAGQTVCQTIPPLSPNLDRTIIQSEIPKSSRSSKLTTMPKNRLHNRIPIRLSYSSIRNVFWRLRSSSWNFTSIRRRFSHSIWRKIEGQLRSFFQRGRQPAMGKILRQPSSTPFNGYTHNPIAPEEQPSLEQYQKKLRELDLCRLCFAKELARNGKFRSAIAEAEQISETSYYFRDAQMLILSWK